ncbi:hypothetical protein DL764_010371 [Monosporascus ibericus]|uniref:Mitochondrial thiamine pyrophosphate carrier 1 n=1 Tax=Monosporascus ibericus TaxID=155417 RepID=A0A4Q4SRM8_9PEZI|nr:hypothetical protein DL764_010371 [Monosporascus ibericus]
MRKQSVNFFEFIWETRRSEKATERSARHLQLFRYPRDHHQGYKLESYTQSPADLRNRDTSSRPTSANVNLALQPEALGAGPQAVAKMAQPTGEPVEDYDYESLPPNFSLTQNMVAGAFAGIAEHTVMYPIDAIKRMQIQNSSKVYRSMFDCAKYVYRNEGLSAFYISYPTTLSMTVPFTALQFLAYESISTVMNPSKQYDPFTHCTAGAVAGGFAAALTTPMDVIKTMLQTRGSATESELRSVNGFAAGCRLMYRREGLRGFFKGVRPRVVTTMPSTAICWSAYEASKAYFIRSNSS